METFRELPINLDIIETVQLPECYRHELDYRDHEITVVTDFSDIPRPEHPGELLSDLEVYHQLRDFTWKEYYIIATNGSKTAVGAVFVDIRTNFAGMFKMSHHCSIYTAKLTAIKKALFYIDEKISTDRS